MADGLIQCQPTDPLAGAGLGSIAAIRSKRGGQPRRAAGSGRLKRFAGDRSAGPASPCHQNLMHPLSCKPISPVPKLANRTPFSFVIDSFLVRTANYAIADRDGSHLMLFEKFKNFAGNGRIGADVAMIYFPGA